jgi:methyltransferase (TIGR00027 family)
MWAGSIEMRYLIPSADDVTLTARVAPERFEDIRRDFHDGWMLVEEVGIVLEAAGRVVANGRIRYVLTRSDKLKPGEVGELSGVLHDHRMKSSARLVAALRGMEEEEPAPLCVDRYGRTMGAAQGRLLAERFLRDTPQLQSMVAARTRDLDDLASSGAFEQLVLLGAGFDARPFRLPALARARVFEVDLPYMLSEREALLASLGLSRQGRIAVPANLELDDLAQALHGCGFDPRLPTLFVLEGVTMYLDGQVNARLLRSVRGLMGDSSSRLWLDAVAASVVERRVDRPEVLRFLDGIARLGEPFVFGIDEAASWFAEARLHVERATPSSSLLGARADDIHGLYTFYELAPVS